VEEKKPTVLSKSKRKEMAINIYCHHMLYYDFDILKGAISQGALQLF